MKSLIACWLLLIWGSVCAQNDSIISISCSKTTSIIFPRIIKAIDRGSRDVLAQKLKGSENVLQLKAARENFIETNLTVVTSDDKLWSFIVDYSARPSALTIEMKTNENIFSDIASKPRAVRGIRNRRYDIVLCLLGIYIEKDILYWQLELKNLSAISYDIDDFRFFITDKKQARRTASQETTLTPLYIYGNTTSVPGESTQNVVLAFPKFTIPEKKTFCIRVTERNGGRHLHLKIGNNKIVNATPIK